MNKSGLLASGGAPQQTHAALLLPLLTTSLLSIHITHVRAVYANRLRAVLSALKDEGLDGYLVRPTKWGGFFVFLRLPVAALEVRARGIEEGVAVSPGEWFSPLPIFGGDEGGEGWLGGKEKANCIRIAFTFYDEDTLRDGIKRLGAVVREMTGEKA